MDLICFPQPQVAPPAGASSGGTTVRILTTGAPFREYTASVACRFNRATVVPATILDVNSVACVSPPAPSHESTSVSQNNTIELTLNGGFDFHPVGDFTYLWPPSTDPTLPRPAADQALVVQMRRSSETEAARQHETLRLRARLSGCASSKPD